MVGDVAVHQPHARIVSFEGDGSEAVTWEEHSVAARRVLFVGSKDVRIVGNPCLVVLLVNNGEIVTVEMDLDGVRYQDA